MKNLLCLALFSSLLCCTPVDRVDKEQRTGDKSTAMMDEGSTEPLRIGYAYWWTVTGPFKGCGEPFAMAVLARVNEMGEIRSDEVMGLKRQRGIFEIDELLASVPLEKEDVSSFQRLSTDACAGLELEAGDLVMIFAFEYEGGYTHGGSKAIIKIDDQNDPLVKSIRHYISSAYDPLVIEADTTIWSDVGVLDPLKEMLNCRYYMMKESTE